jgi:hypothetical protein
MTDRVWTLDPAPNDQWVDLKMHVHWASTDAGMIELWVDGKQTVTQRTPTIYEGKFVYLKQGLSRSPSKLMTTLYQDAAVVSSQESGLSCLFPTGIGPSPTAGQSGE